MNSLNGKAILYHGTQSFFEEFDLRKAKPFKDFGKGFYLTSHYEQAYAWASGRESDFCYLYEYTIDIPDDNDFEILELTEYNVAWLDYIAKNRTDPAPPSDFDIVYDKLADSRSKDITKIIDKYRATKDSISASNALRKLSWNGPGDQYCFKTDRAIACLNRQRYRCFVKNQLGEYVEASEENFCGKE